MNLIDAAHGITPDLANYIERKNLQERLLYQVLENEASVKSLDETFREDVLNSFMTNADVTEVYIKFCKRLNLPVMDVGLLIRVSNIVYRQGNLIFFYYNDQRVEIQEYEYQFMIFIGLAYARVEDRLMEEAGKIAYQKRIQGMYKLFEEREPLPLRPPKVDGPNVEIDEERPLFDFKVMFYCIASITIVLGIAFIVKHI